MDMEAGTRRRLGYKGEAVLSSGLVKSGKSTTEEGMRKSINQEGYFF
jgi:hypothetical protein